MIPRNVLGKHIVGVLVACILASWGCARHQEKPMITAVGLSPSNRCDPPGIPYYLPKPLLVVAKNVRHIDESKVGLTGPAPIPGGFDNQAAYGDIKANVTVPGTTATPATGGNTTFTQNLDGQTTPSTHAYVAEAMTPSGTLDDGIEPDSFFTYQVIFVPDLSQKYGLQITGGAGEFRAAMNMVNGWMYTGMGPFYFKDSSSAQNAMATGVASMYAGRGAADVLNEVGELTSAIGQLPRGQEGGDYGTVEDLTRAFEAIARAAEVAPKVPETMLNYAEVYIYEPVLLPDGMTTEWRLVAEHHFDRQFFVPGDAAQAAQAKAEIVKSMVGALSSSKANSPSGDVEATVKKVLAQQEEAKRRPISVPGNQEGGNFGGDQGLEDLKNSVPKVIPMNGLPMLNQPTAPNQVPGISGSGKLLPPPVQVNINAAPSKPPVESPASHFNPLSWFHHDKPSVRTDVETQQRFQVLQ